VFVASLFTHLPDRTFGMWLAKLVAPGGVLVFSVHDEAINRGGVPLHDGFAFIPRSEVSAISVEDYGTNFTTADYVRRRLETAIAPTRAKRSDCPEHCVLSRTFGSCHAGAQRYVHSSTSVALSVRSIVSTSGAARSR
jgi:hypothetical protein